jgi:hypothetical protein
MPRRPVMVGENIAAIREAISVEEVSPGEPELNSTMCSKCRVELEVCGAEEHPGRKKIW